MISLNDLIEKPRKAAKSYSEILPWFALIAPGLVLCQDGSILAGFDYEGEDVEGKLPFQVNQRIDLLENAFRVLNDRCTIWNIQDRYFTTGYIAGEFASPVAKVVDDQWKAALGTVRNARLSQKIFIGYNFPNKSEAVFEALRAEIDEHDGQVLPALRAFIKKRMSSQGAVANVRGQLAEMVSEFQQVLNGFAGIVESSLGFRRLFDGDLLGSLYERANPASEPGPLHEQNTNAYLNTLLAADSMVRRNDMLEFKGPVKTKYVAALSTTGKPRQAVHYYVDDLMGADAEYTLVQCFKILDRQVAEKHIQDAEQHYRTEVKSVFTRVFERLTDSPSEKINTGNLVLAQDAQDALVELTAGQVNYGWYNLTLLAKAGTQREADKATDILASNMRTNGFTVVRERQGLISAFLTTLPGGSGATLRWKLASTANLADLAPIRTISRGERNHPLFSNLLGHNVPPMCRFLTGYGLTYDFNPHEMDLGHTAIIGGSGAGKTSLVSLFLCQFQKYSPSQTFIFDKDYSLMMTTVLLGGKHIDISGKRVGMNPVKTMLHSGPDGDQYLRSWIEVLIGAGGGTITPEDSQTIFSAIQALKFTPDTNWRLSQIYANIAGMDSKLASQLAPYVDRTDDDEIGRGSFSHYFDNEEDSFTLSNIVGMECGALLDMPEVASPFMDYVFFCINRRLDGQTPTMIYLEEAWYMLKNRRFYEKMDDWLRTFRKKRAFLMFATQALDEIAQLPNLGGFVANIPTQILLPAVKKSVRQQAGLYASVFDINEAQLDLLSRAIPKRDYLIVKPNLTRLVSAVMPPAIIAMNEATTRPDYRASVLEWSESGIHDWQLKFLKDVLNVEI